MIPCAALEALRAIHNFGGRWGRLFGGAKAWRECAIGLCAQYIRLLNHGRRTYHAKVVLEHCRCRCLGELLDGSALYLPEQTCMRDHPLPEAAYVHECTEGT